MSVIFGGGSGGTELAIGLAVLTLKPGSGLSNIVVLRRLAAALWDEADAILPSHSLEG